MKKIFLPLFFLVLALGAFVVGVTFRQTNSSQPVREIDRRVDRVAKVLDGDTIIINNGQRVRYLGIDSPEQNKPWAEAAKKFNQGLVLGKEIQLEFDHKSDRYDKYQRLLAYVWVGEILVNEKLVDEGLAKVSVLRGSSLKYIKRLYEAQRQAKEKKRGIWVEK